MIDLSEIENLDVVLSTKYNISLLLKTLDDISNSSNVELEKSMKIVEKKILEIEDYYLRPVDSREVYEKLSAAFKTNNENEKADEYYKRIARMDSDLFEFKGRLHNFFGNNKKAMEYYQKSVEFMPENQAAQNGFKKARNRFMKSSEQLEKFGAEATKSQSVKSYIKFGRALADVGRMEEAFDAYAEALTIEPENDEAMARKGTALESLNRFDEAVELFKKAQAINPKSMIAKRGINYASYYFNHPNSEYYKD